MHIKTNFYTITAYQNLCHVKVCSAWDERVMTDYLRHWTKVCSNIYSDKEWAILIDKRDWGLYTPDAGKMLAREIKTTTVTKPSAWAFIVGSSELKKWQTNKDLTENDKHGSKCFETLDEGKNWLASLGYETTPIDGYTYRQ